VNNLLKVVTQRYPDSRVGFEPATYIDRMSNALPVAPPRHVADLYTPGVYDALFGSATVTPLSARLKRPNDDATLQCTGTSPAEVVSGWYRNSSDGKYFKLAPATDAGKYRVSNDSLTVLKVGE